MVWYCKYQFRYIIGLWSQKWKKMCVSSRSPHLFFEKLFYWRAMSLSLVRLDSVRRIIEVNPMKFLSNVLKTSSTLHLYAEKKKANSERYFKTFYSSVNLRTVLLQPEEKAKLKRPAYQSNEFHFFLTRSW